VPGLKGVAYNLSYSLAVLFSQGTRELSSWVLLFWVVLGVFRGTPFFWVISMHTPVVSDPASETQGSDDHPDSRLTYLGYKGVVFRGTLFFL
jgi:hypothetical protein